MFGMFKKKQVVPSEFDLEGAHSMSEFTPDIALLETKRSQLLFVYDHWQRGHRDFSLIEEYSVPLGVAFTRDTFALYKRKMGIESYAIPLRETEYDAPIAPVRGQLYAVLPVRFIELDNNRRNGIIFNRERVELIIPYQVDAWYKEGGSSRSEVRYQKVKAWMYVGNQEYWTPLIEEDFFLFDPVRTFQPKNPDLLQYYSFTKLEYEDT